MGLPAEANAFLATHSKRKNVCAHCARDDGPVRERIGRVGMFEDLSLFEYELQDGRTAKEVVQQEIWSSGPMIWLQLEISDGTTLAWNPADIVED